MHRRHRFICQFLSLVIFLCLTACQSKQTDNILLNKLPLNQTISNASNITDGVHANEGAQWNTREASIIDDSTTLIYDLGESKTIDTLLLQADNNDGYQISASDDDEHYQVIWNANPLNRGHGLSNRHISSLNIQTRYLKLAVTYGDSAYSIAEFSAFSTKPAHLPKTSEPASSLGPNELVKSAMLSFGLALLLFLYLAYAGAAKGWLALCALLPLAGSYELLSTLYQHWPPQPTQVALFRGVLAGVAALAVARTLLSCKLLPASLLTTYIVLAITALLSFSAFYNLGHPQFRHSQKGEWTYIHYLDLRQYYPTAKYFPELGYHDIYVADIAAYLEDDPKHTLNNIGHYAMRDLHNNQMKQVKDYAREIEQVKNNFSKERWQAYKDDARYIRSLMSDDEYFRYLIDYGGNATPVWMSQLYLLFNAFEISDQYALLLAALDPILLLLMFFCIWRSFGLMTMCVSMVVFGANDFIMYGTNWGGAILRHDWMFYTGFGLCSLKTKRYLFGGALIGAGAMVRAFPFFAYCGIAMITLWWLWQHLQSTKRMPTAKEFIRGNASVLQVAAGAAAIAITLYLFSSLLFSFEAWSIWWSKIHTQQGGALPNHIGLRSLLAGWDNDQQDILKSRQLIHISAIVLMLGLMLFAILNRTIEKAAILGLLLMWIIYYPQNYYIHFIIFLPLLVDSSKLTQDQPLSPSEISIYLSILLLCVFQYTPTLINDNLGLHFYFSNVFLCACIASILLILAKTKQPDKEALS